MPFLSRKPRDTDERETPDDLFDLIDELVGPLTLDVCATAKNAKTLKFYGLPAKDGLVERWHTGWWCNPPYSNIECWAEKAITERTYGVMLVPAAPETRWWQMLWGAAIEVAFLAPRVRFLKDGALMGSPQFGSAVFILGPRLLINVAPRSGIIKWRRSTWIQDGNSKRARSARATSESVTK